MSPRTGRPTDDPKNLTLKVRLSQKDIERLKFCQSKTSKSKAEIIRIGIQEVYESLQKEK